MGKRQNLSGLARFVKDAFAQPEEESTKPQQATASLNNSSIGKTRKASQLEEDEPVQKSNKKRKIGLLGPGWESYDATGLVPRYTHASQVPEQLVKYFHQRHRYFSLYDEGCLLDEVGWYSVTPEGIATQIAERCRCATILDAFCGVGGNAIAFAQTCERVIALDTSPVRLALARHNAAIYGVVDRIEFILGDYLSFARSYLSTPHKQRKIDVVFLSPPWGGPDYISGDSSPSTNEKGKARASLDDSLEYIAHPEFNLSSIQPVHGAELFKLSRQITPNIAYFLPRNSNLEEISQMLVDDTKEKAPQIGQKKRRKGGEMVEVEEEWIGKKLKAITCYFGGLAQGQEDMFEG
ncbi:RNA cap guanine-N2 methyltransferase-domain-containing protein [Abortiporus biennis]|nr:RNA cap guanine-N2 methyltransferase-domain-containing protein [Abortiporus biennis]